jgi:predicted PurR-regulated permease PerM
LPKFGNDDEGYVMTKQTINTLDIEGIIKVVILGVILYYAISVVRPFIVPVLWGIIIAITFSPLINKLQKSFPERRKRIIVIGSVLMVLVLLIPTYILSESVIDSSQELAHNLREGTIVIPPPSENVKSWPLIGEKTYTLWNGAAHDLENTILKFKPQFREYAGGIASAIASALGGILQFVISLIIAAVFLTKIEDSIEVSNAIAKKLIGDKGEEWAHLSALTIRSVVQGVIGIAIIQSVLSFIGLVLIGVPLAWFWSFVVLFFAIIQLPPLIVLGPIIAYVFSYADSTPAVIFAIYTIFVSMSDGFLKPFLLGRGVDIPMLIILIGAIGGMILSGILGLFIGAVGLALAYKLFMVWLDDNTDEELAKV